MFGAAAIAAAMRRERSRGLAVIVVEDPRPSRNPFLYRSEIQASILPRGEAQNLHRRRRRRCATSSVPCSGVAQSVLTSRNDLCLSRGNRLQRERIRSDHVSYRFNRGEMWKL